MGDIEPESNLYSLRLEIDLLRVREKCGSGFGRDESRLIPEHKMLE